MCASTCRRLSWTVGASAVPVSPGVGFSTPSRIGTRGTPAPFKETKWERESRNLYAKVPASVLLKEAELLTRGALDGGPSPNGEAGAGAVPACPQTRRSG